MSEPWSDNPNAPQIPLSLYTWEKTAFAGYFVGSIFHGRPAHVFVHRRSLHCSIHHSRYRRRSILSMYYRAVQSNKPREGRHRVGTRGPYRSPFCERDGIHRHRLLYSIRILHQRQRVPWRRWPASWTHRILVDPQVRPPRNRCKFRDPAESVAGRWPFGEFYLKLSRPGIQPQPLPQLYRCYIIYNMNYWAVVFPFVMYLASWGACSSSLQANNGTLG